MKYILSLFLSFLCITSLWAQLSNEEKSQLDQIFEAWNKEDHPGGVAAVSRNGEIIWEQAYGLASLEYNVPNTTNTLFNIASVSKQFSAMAMVRLHQEGKIDIDHEVQKYLDFVPQFDQKVTIRHLLHHTSGLRSLHALMSLAGWRADDVKSNEDLNRLMSRQKELNFEPGAEYLYCNTGFMFMASIVEEVTGQSFADYMKSEIFEPLGMKHTYVEDQYNRVAKNYATSYQVSEDYFVKEVEYWGYVGSGNMHSNTQDLLFWLDNFSNPKPGWEESFQMMQTLDPFNDGTVNNYAFGVNVTAFRGNDLITHGGSIGGFRSQIGHFPESNLSLVVMSNYNRGNPGGKMRQMASLLLEDKSEITSPPKRKYGKLKMKSLSGYPGTFWNENQKYMAQIKVLNDSLFLQRRNQEPVALLPLRDQGFEIKDSDGVRIELTGTSPNRRLIIQEAGKSDILFSEFPTSHLTPENLQEYAGTYYSPEVDNYYTISYHDGVLEAYHVRHGYLEVEWKKKDVLSGNYPLSIMEFERDSNNEITGLRVTNGRVRNLLMVKQ